MARDFALNSSPTHRKGRQLCPALTWREAAIVLLSCAVVGLLLERGIGRVPNSRKFAHGRMVNDDSSSSLNVNGGTFAPKATFPSPVCHEKDAGKDGELEFVSYTSSKLEKLFLEKLPEMNFPTERPDDPKPWGTGPLTEYCDFVMTYYQEIVHWVTKLEEVRSTGAMYYEDKMSQDVFSVFEFRYKCDSSSANADGYCSYKTMIEPLSFFLRHPAAKCTDRFPADSPLLLKPNAKRLNGLLDQSYLFYATHEQTDFGPGENTHVDLGALVRGEQGQTHFLIREYEQQGVEFSHMLMWEAEQVTGDVIFETVPDQWYHAYQFFDQPVTTNISSEAHPLQVLKRVHPGTGFVAFKMDIDQNEIENTVVDKLIEWHDQYPCVKAGQMEFFFEQHVDLPIMRIHWKTTATESGKTLSDSYELFLKMRKLGMRAHGWI